MMRLENQSGLLSGNASYIVPNSAKYLFGQVFDYNQIIPTYFIVNDVSGEIQVDPAFGDWAWIRFNIWLS